jgi:hypothetical protein
LIAGRCITGDAAQGLKWWEQLRRSIDLNNNGTIDKEEFVQQQITTMISLQHEKPSNVTANLGV